MREAQGLGNGLQSTSFYDRYQHYCKTGPVKKSGFCQIPDTRDCGVTVTWAYPRFWQPHFQKPYDMCVPGTLTLTQIAKVVWEGVAHTTTISLRFWECLSAFWNIYVTKVQFSRRKFSLKMQFWAQTTCPLPFDAQCRSLLEATQCLSE